MKQASVFHEFETTLQKTASLMEDLEKSVHCEGHPHQAYQVLRAALHTLRDRLPPHEAVNFGSQLPLLIRGVYYDGWTLDEKPIKWHRGEFIDATRAAMGPFDSDLSSEQLVQRALFVIARHIGEGEMEKIKKVLPQDLRAFLDESFV